MKHDDTAKTVQRHSSRAGRGEPMVWLSLLALGLCVTMIVALVGLIISQGMTTFWPGPIQQITLNSGETILGVPIRSELIDAPSSESTEAEEPTIERTLYRVGNKEFTGQPFRWIPKPEIASIEFPRDAVLVERTEWGVWLGRLESIIEIEDGEQRIIAGAVAASAYERIIPLKGKVKRVILLGPAHRVAFKGFALPSVDTFDTPLGAVRLDRALIDRLVDVRDDCAIRVRGGGSVGAALRSSDCSASCGH